MQNGNRTHDPRIMENSSSKRSACHIANTIDTMGLYRNPHLVSYLKQKFIFVQCCTYL